MTQRGGDGGREHVRLREGQAPVDVDALRDSLDEILQDFMLLLDPDVFPLDLEDAGVAAGLAGDLQDFINRLAAVLARLP